MGVRKEMSPLRTDLLPNKDLRNSSNLIETKPIWIHYITQS